VPTQPGYHIWEYNGPPLLLVNTPLLSPWLDAQGYAQVLGSWKFTNSTGTSTPSIDGSFDGLAADADLTALYGAPSSGVAFAVLSPWFRFHVTQATADATVTKIFLQARLS
jgi:hypothetical protein